MAPTKSQGRNSCMGHSRRVPRMRMKGLWHPFGILCGPWTPWATWSQKIAKTRKMSKMVEIFTKNATNGGQNEGPRGDQPFLKSLFLCMFKENHLGGPGTTPGVVHLAANHQKTVKNGQNLGAPPPTRPSHPSDGPPIALHWPTQAPRPDLAPRGPAGAGI
jgi:hypothetical protein